MRRCLSDRENALKEENDYSAVCTHILSNAEHDESLEDYNSMAENRQEFHPS